MRKNPEISVVLPYFNAEKTIGRAIESILSHDHEDFELILVNNQSTDRGPDITASFKEKDRRILLEEENRQGVVYASNKGSSIARGKYIARMDADDRMMPCRLRIQSDYLDHHPDVGAVAGLVKHVSHDENTEGFARYVEWSNAIQSAMDIYHRRFIESPVVNPSAMWRRDVAEKYGMYRQGDFPEDYELWLRWLDQGVKIVKLPEIVLEWYDSAGRLTRNLEQYSDRACYRIKSRYLAGWLKKNNPYHPFVAVWGASRISRRRANLLEEYGIKFHSYIDTKRTRQIRKKIIYHEDLPEAGSMFILTYIKQMNNREKIRSFLESRGYREGVDYLMVS